MHANFDYVPFFWKPRKFKQSAEEEIPTPRIVSITDEGLAVVMGHEIAHAVAKHSVERASQAVLLNIGSTILDSVLDGALSASRVDDYVVQLGINLPFGRYSKPSKSIRSGMLLCCCQCCHCFLF